MRPKSRRRERGVVKVHVLAALSTGYIPRYSINRRPGHCTVLASHSVATALTEPPYSLTSALSHPIAWQLH